MLSESRIWDQRLAATCGLIGAVLLVAYFGAPAVLGWPFAGAPAASIAAYATSHESLFYLGAWLQGTGTLLSVVFFLSLVRDAGAVGRVAGLVVVVASAALLALVLVEGAVMVAVPIAAAGGDMATVATTFALSNGVFVRVFPIAPSSAAYLALGAVLWSSDVLPRGFAYGALAIGAAFELGGIVTIFVGGAAIALAALAAVQVLWIVLAAVWLWRQAA